jgi:ATP:ADP antiporter, AAA family
MQKRLDWLRRVMNLRTGEALPVALSALFFCLVLAALMVARPARDALGMQRGIESVRWLFFGTALITLLVNPVFGWLVSRFSRVRFLSTCYGFFSLSLIGFYLLLRFAPEAIGARTGQIFYVWFSVFNFFATMLFWALMSDRFSLAQGKRFFPLIAAGGTLGAILGPWLAAQLATPLGTPALLLVAALLLLLALAAALGVAHTQTTAAASGPPQSAGLKAHADHATAIGGSAWAGLIDVLKSHYLLGISAYVLMLSVMVTFLYFTRLQMVAAQVAQLDQRTTSLAWLDVYTQLATLAVQVVIAGHLIRRIGVSLTLMLLPLTAALGFIGLALLSSMAALIVFESVFRAMQRAVMNPARETLFTVLTRSEKYKAKAVIDTFVYRTGDVIGAQTDGLLARLGLGLSALAGVAVPLAMVWAALGFWLGAQQRKAAASEPLEAKPAR